MTQLMSAVLLSLPCGADAAPSREAVPSCGVACLYYLAREKDIETSIPEIEQCVHGTYPDADLDRLSIQQVETVAGKLGISLRAVKVDSQSIKDIPLPAILYVRSERMGRAPGDLGHMVVLIHAGADRARVFDPQGTVSAEFTWDEFWSGYDGELLAQTDKPVKSVNRPAMTWFALLASGVGCVLLSAWIIIIVRKLGRSSGRAAALIIVSWGIVSSSTGCKRSQESRAEAAAEAPLKFETTTRDLGVIADSGVLLADYKFTVTGPRGCVIRSITPSCSCMTVNAEGLIGKPLEPGREGHITVSVKDPGMVGALEGQAMVQVDPPAAPIILKFHARVLLGAQLQVQSLPTSLRVQPAQIVRFEIVVSRTRSVDGKDLVFDPNKSGGPGLRISGDQISISKVEPYNIQSTTVVRETHRFLIDALPIEAIGEKRVPLTICWADPAQKCLSADMVIVVEHPLALAQPKLFMGYLMPGETQEHFVTASDPRKFFECFGSVQTEKGAVAAQYDKGAGGLRIKVTAPMAPGKFTYVLTLHGSKTAADRAPPLAFHVTGIVGRP